MEDMQALGFFRNTTGILKSDGKPSVGFEDRLRKERDERRESKGRDTKRPTAPYQLGRNNLDKSNGPAPATTAHRATHLAGYPIPGPVRDRRPTQNAVAGPSHSGPVGRRQHGDIQRARRALTNDLQEGDYIVEVSDLRDHSERRSGSPTKPNVSSTIDHTTRSSPHDNPRAARTGPMMSRTDVTHRSDIPDNRSLQTRRLSTGSTSPKKGKQKAPQRPQEIVDVWEAREIIEDPDGTFRNDGGHSDIEFVEPNTAMAERTRSRKSKSASSASPTKAPAQLVSLKGKEKASDQQTPLHERVSNGDEDEIRAVDPTPKKTRGIIIQPSGVFSNVLRCNTGVLWCIDMKREKRKMRVRQVELHNDGITLGNSTDRQKGFVFLHCLSIIETLSCERQKCPLIYITVSTKSKHTKVDSVKLLQLIASGASNKFPTKNDITEIKIGIPLETALGSEFVARYNTVMKPYIRDEHFRFSARGCEDQMSVAFKDFPPPFDPSQQPEAEPPLPRKPAAKPAWSRTQEVQDAATVPQRMEAKVKRFDNAKDNDKGKQRERQQELPYQPSGRALPATNDVGPARKSKRLSGNKVVDDLCSDDEEVVPEAPRAPAIAPPPDRGTVLFPYPLTGRATLNITKGELWRVQSGEFLNDTLIEWGLKHLIDGLIDEGRDPNVHLFNSFFYTKISSKDIDKRLQRGTGSQVARWPAYEAVRKWTKSVDVFSKKFIVVPINEDYHWYLAVIFNPGAMLVTKSDSSSDSASTEAIQTPEQNVTPEDTPDVSDEKMVDDQLGTNAITPDETQESIVAVSNPAEVMDVDDKSDDGTPHVGDDSMDPLDCIGQPDGPVMHTAPVSRMKKLTIEPDKDTRRAAKRAPPPPGREITSVTLDVFKSQHAVQASGSEAAKAKVVELEAVKPVSKKPDRLADHNILKSQKPWVITFDSLGSQHKAVGRYLNEWLQWEAKSKKGELYGDIEAEYTHAQVPLQANFSDCGLYLVHYARRLLTEPETILQLVQRRLPHKASEERKKFDSDVDSIWKVSRDHNLRDEWQATITSLKDMYDDQSAKGVKDEKAKSDAGLDEAVDDSTEDFMEVAPPGSDVDGAPPESTEAVEPPGPTRVEEAEPTENSTEQEAIPNEPATVQQESEKEDEIVAERSPRTINALGLEYHSSRETSRGASEPDVPSTEEIVAAISAASTSASETADPRQVSPSEQDDGSIATDASSSEVSSSSDSNRASGSPSGINGGLNHAEAVDHALDDSQGGASSGHNTPSTEMEEVNEAKDEPYDEMTPYGHVNPPIKQGSYFLPSPTHAAAVDPKSLHLIKRADLNHPSNPRSSSGTPHANDYSSDHPLSPDPPARTTPQGYGGQTMENAIDVDDDDDENQDDNDYDKENAPPTSSEQMFGSDHIVAEPPARPQPTPSTSIRSDLFDLSMNSVKRRKMVVKNGQSTSAHLESPLALSVTTRDGGEAERPASPTDHRPPSSVSTSELFDLDKKSAKRRKMVVENGQSTSAYLKSPLATPSTTHDGAERPASPTIHQPPSSISTAKVAPPARPSSMPPWQQDMGSMTSSALSKFADIGPPSSVEGTPVNRSTRSSHSDIFLIDRNGNIDALESRSEPDEGLNASPRRSSRVTATAVAAIISGPTRAPPVRSPIGGTVALEVEDADFDNATPANAFNGTSARNHRPAQKKYGKKDGKKGLRATTETQTVLPFGSPAPMSENSSGPSRVKRQSTAPRNEISKKQKYAEARPGHTPAKITRGSGRPADVIEVDGSDGD